MRNIDVLKGLYLDQYVQVHTTAGDTGPSGSYSTKVIIGVVHDMLDDYIIITEVEGMIKNPIVVMFSQVVSIEAVPSEIISDLKFDMAEQALLASRRAEEDGSLN
jgi:ferredoxin-fold anticodon binding domain-containing protein